MAQLHNNIMTPSHVLYQIIPEWAQCRTGSWAWCRGSFCRTSWVLTDRSWRWGSSCFWWTGCRACPCALKSNTRSKARSRGWRPLWGTGCRTGATGTRSWAPAAVYCTPRSTQSAYASSSKATAASSQTDCSKKPAQNQISPNCRCPTNFRISCQRCPA